MSRARFIAAARLEFLAEVIFYNEAQAGLGSRFTAQLKRRLPVRLPSLYPDLLFVPILAACSCRNSHSRLSTGRSQTGSLSLLSHIMRSVLTTGNLGYVPANRRIDADRFAAGHAGR